MPPASEGHRLPPAAIPVMAMEHGLPLLIGIIPLLSRSGATRFLVLVPLLFVVGGPVVRFLRFRYWISGSQLVLEGGLLFRWRREIPFARVQSIDTVQKLRHRLLGVVELRVEVVGGRATEASFPALEPQEADRIRAIVLAGATEEQVSEAPHLARMSVGDLLVAGATGGRVAVVALMLGYLQELLPEDRAAGLFEMLSRSSVTLIVAVVATFLIVSVVVSLIATVVVYWDFTVRREGRRVVITRGLLDRRRAVIPFHRLQALRLHANPIRRLLGMVTVSAVLAGYTQESEESRQTSVVLPVGRRAEAFRLVERLLDVDGDLAAASLEGLCGRALVRRLVSPVAGGLLLGAAGLTLFGGRGVVAFVAGILGGLWAWLTWRGVGHALVGGLVLVRTGALWRRLYVVPIANVSHLEMASSPLQRPLSLSSLRLKIPKATPALVDLSAPRAQQAFASVADRLYERAPAR